jgi:hypothetical protein
MRSKRIVTGLNNSQRLRVIVNGVGFYTTVEGVTEMCFTSQRVAVWQALEHMALNKIKGYAASSTVYDESMKSVRVDFQVDLV